MAGYMDPGFIHEAASADLVELAAITAEQADDFDPEDNIVRGGFTTPGEILAFDDEPSFDENGDPIYSS